MPDPSCGESGDDGEWLSGGEGTVDGGSKVDDGEGEGDGGGEVSTGGEGDDDEGRDGGLGGGGVDNGIASLNALFAAASRTPFLSSDASHHIIPARPSDLAYLALIAMLSGSSYEMKPSFGFTRYGTLLTSFQDRDQPFMLM